ncbi:putative bifunctional diguanylate cyclase/phosphodiesterase [Zavarzinia sp. CC-PAN008]|uniref:putative bifunctional diguanylate cyclase/phosphodiesterase n=1 Tax=Zavarzinia sp. CC-PAN008 TaxID=3243332 RepID=UPI003F744C16
MALVAATVVMAVVLLFQIAAEQDAAAELQSRALAERALDAHRAHLQRSLHDYAAWGDAYRHVLPQVDLDWAYQRENMGPTLHSDLGFNLVAVVGADDDARYALTDGVLVMGALPAPLRETLRDLAHQARDTADGIRPPMLLAPLPGEPPLLIAAEVVSPAADPTIPLQPGPQPVLVFGSRLDDAALAALGRTMLLSDMRLAPPGTCRSGTSGLPLRDPAGAALGDLCWTPARPGQEMVRFVLPWLLGGFAFLGILMVLLLRNARHTARLVDGWSRRLTRAYADMREKSALDPVTLELNGQGFEIEATKRLTLAEERSALLLLGLDRVKLISDVFGHVVGDGLLRRAADRIRQVVGADALVARTGQDDFAVLLPAAPAEAMEALARRLVEALEQPLDVDGIEAHVGVTVGLARADGAIRTAERLLQCADMAMHAARAEGTRIRAYDHGLGEEATLQQKLEADLRGALARNEFSLVYQPRYDARTLAVTGVETLVRWTHPTLGAVSPARFIPLAERTGLIHDLGHWVLETACLDLVSWPDLTVAVNMSPMQFQKSGAADLVARVLQRTSLPAARLELELTESVLFEYYGGAKDSLHEIKALGVRIALDDFGTGFSSLGYLMDFRFDRLKIDRRFVKEIKPEGEARTIVQTIIRLASALGMAVTAEGIETPLQMDVLRAEGCDELQGFLLARPMPLADLERLLLAQRDSAAASPGPLDQTEPTIVALATG